MTEQESARRDSRVSARWAPNPDRVAFAKTLGKLSRRSCALSDGVGQYSPSPERSLQVSNGGLCDPPIVGQMRAANGASAGGALGVDGRGFGPVGITPCFTQHHQEPEIDGLGSQAAQR